MKPAVIQFALLSACLLWPAAGVSAQAPAQGPTQAPAQPPAQAPAQGSGQNAPAQQTPKTPPAAANPFPEDTSNVPVLPSTGAPVLPEGTEEGTPLTGHVNLPNANADPVRSPDDPDPSAATNAPTESSSTVPGMDKMTDPGDDDQQAKHRKMAVKPPEHVETSKEDLDVGKYYLEKRNWKAALSRFQSAQVLAPEEPEVYWGLAESERNLGQFADARANYQKVLDYDPDGPHGKAARKALKEPEIANAKAGSQAPSANQAH